MHNLGYTAGQLAVPVRSGLGFVGACGRLSSALRPCFVNVEALYHQWPLLTLPRLFRDPFATFLR
eukprot:3934515-Pleurochrysis_carterae.AAC.2